jgi:catechol 2,3-dioxygenase-like lactoylglutathione lyase family enzyme
MLRVRWKPEVQVPFARRLSLVTLGVADIHRARAFYERLGLTPAKASKDDVAFYQLGGAVLALFPREKLAEDATVANDGAGFDGLTLAQNVGSPEEVDAVLAQAVEAGARLVKPGQKVFWGGYSGYFADPDGHLWEIAHNPFFAMDANGNLVLE